MQACTDTLNKILLQYVSASNCVPPYIYIPQKRYTNKIKVNTQVMYGSLVLLHQHNVCITHEYVINNLTLKCHDLES